MPTNVPERAWLAARSVRANGWDTRVRVAAARGGGRVEGVTGAQRRTVLSAVFRDAVDEVLSW